MALVLNRNGIVDSVLSTLQLNLSEFYAVGAKNKKRDLTVWTNVVRQIVVGALIGTIRLNLGQCAFAVEVNKEILPIFLTDGVLATNESEETLLDLGIGLHVRATNRWLRVGHSQTRNAD